ILRCSRSPSTTLAVTASPEASEARQGAILLGLLEARASLTASEHHLSDESAMILTFQLMSTRDHVRSAANGAICPRQGRFSARRVNLAVGRFQRVRF